MRLEITEVCGKDVMPNQEPELPHTERSSSRYSQRNSALLRSALHGHLLIFLACHGTN